MTKLGFLGAMNRDVVVHQPAAMLCQALGVDAPRLLETPVSDAVAARGANTLEVLGAATYLGGSAFNTARVVAMLDRRGRHDLAFFGIAGSLDGHHPHLDALAAWRVDTSRVERSLLPPATCLAMVEPAGRTLLTAHGANAGIANWLQRRSAELAQAIATCDIVHVTSFLDPATPALVAAILSEARTHNPALVVSLDPGMAWVAPGGEGFSRLMRQANILHLNAEEFAKLGGVDAVRRIGPTSAPNWTIVARTHDSASIYSAAPDGTVTRSSLATAPLPQEISDATGAGDTFCGGFLYAFAAHPTEPLEAAGLGFALARAKIAHDGPLTAELAHKTLDGTKIW